MLIKSVVIAALGASVALAQGPADGNWERPRRHPHRGQIRVAEEENLQCADHQKSYCCTQTVAPDAPGVGILASLLDNLFIGLECTPLNLNLLAIDSTAQCKTNVVCCSGKQIDGGKMQLGCESSKGSKGSKKQTRL
ncbi:hypothetical protein CXG81DRAFT_18974 [Caulochytrium protostelioides]|uniref:Hydrophobin n=1 Tax=Caulochytrium protostelioides TaxID=1555241 RepID=A0A4P9X899_9FUNG|nr:hypothetical protein CXG81DRAFT_18974 [Caulochytrium protostelioides]|eukprot:RKP01201.1 hypothetical protein CXG81DRAFT_18974 [Caulochytrium protostelioides]